jgi:hypothetical protein
MCGVDLGPWEDGRGCLSCGGEPPWSIADRAVRILEQVDHPLPYWDIHRLMQANGAPRVYEASLKSQLASDKRMCWAGRGSYGLFRHGLLPGVRDLSRVAGIYLHAADAELNLVQLSFVMRHVGFRFRDISLRSALWRGIDLGIYWGTDVSSWRGYRHAGAAAARAMGLRGGPLFYAIDERTTKQVEDGLRELERRQA